MRTVANFVLSAALDRQAPAAYRPARRCGVIRTSSVAKRTVALLVRYRFQLILPGRYGEVPLIAEDARVLGFTGGPSAVSGWLPDAEAAALLDAKPDENTMPEFAARTISTVLSGLDEVLPHLNARGEEFAEELREAHRRVRRVADQTVRGVRVSAAGDADILGVYVCLPVTAQMGAGQ